MNFSSCRSCGAQILWAITPSGKKMPLNVSQNTNSGNVRLRSDGVAIVGPPGSGSYYSHFVTCPQAGRHRRPR